MNPLKWFRDLKKDAERYRWLRSQHVNFNPLLIVTQEEQRPGTYCPSGESLDHCIDEYIKGSVERAWNMELKGK
jgi:hypothetical protein